MKPRTTEKVEFPIVVTGSTGFLGRNLMPVLMERYGEANIVGLSSLDYNLLDQHQHKKMFEDLKPETLVHLAAYSGGIGANNQYPADFFYRNITIISQGFQLAQEHKVKKIVFPLGGCSYPADAVSPIDESQIWNGFPQVESAGYSMAKKMGIVAAMSYRKQYGLRSAVIIPGNMYGEYDNFRIGESHVIPAMIRRFYEAKIANAPKVVMWGTGKPVRDFVYVRDVADIIPFFIEDHDGEDPVNISTGTVTSIRDLAERIRSLVAYTGTIEWDNSKPDGQMTKIFSTKKLVSLGLSCPTSLGDGLKDTIEWFQRNYPDRSDGLRV